MAAKLYWLYALGVLFTLLAAIVGVLIALVNGDWRWLLLVFPFAFLLSQLIVRPT